MEIKDSGTRREFESGAVRDGEIGKGRFDLIPPVALELLAKHFEGGALKYSERNWEKGIPLGSCLDSCLRHVNKYRDGQRDEPHIVAAFWNLAAFLHTREMIKRGILPASLDNLPSYQLNECDKSGPGILGKCPEDTCSDCHPNVNNQESKTYTVYFSHHIRGEKGADATDADMLENRKDAIAVCNRVRELLPNWDIYCPGEHDDIIMKLWRNGDVDEDAILHADCQIIDEKDAVIAYAKDGYISKGMQVELDYARTNGIPSFAFAVLDYSNLCRFTNVIEWS